MDGCRRRWLAAGIWVWMWVSVGKVKMWVGGWDEYVGGWVGDDVDG